MKIPRKVYILLLVHEIVKGFYEYGSAIHDIRQIHSGMILKFCRR